MSRLFEYSFLIVGIILVYIAIAFALYASRQNSGSGRRSFWAYLFLWPLLLPPQKIGRKPESINRFIVVGLIVMVLLIVGSIVIHPAVR